MAPTSNRNHRGTPAFGSRWALGVHLVVSLVIHHVVSAQQLSAPNPAGTVTTTTTTTTTTVTRLAAPLTAAGGGSAGVGSAVVDPGTPAWKPTVTRSPSPSPLPSPSPSPAVTISSSSSSSGGSSGARTVVTGTGSPLTNEVAETATSATGQLSVSNPVTSAAGTGARATVQPVAASKVVWRPTYPFPQCATTTLSYDVSFVGPMKSIQVGTVKYAYHRFGPLRPSAPQQQPLLSRNTKPNAPVMFISGWGTAMYMWPVPLLQRLADTREVIIFDNMRTASSTDTSTASLSIPLMANSTAALINKLGLQTPDIWGWSLGGMVAYGLLALHPDKVGNVIIAAASPGGPDALLPPVPVTQEITAIQRNYTALLPYLFPQGTKDEGVCAFYAAYNSFYASKYTALSTPLGENSITEQSQAVVKFFKDPSVINRLQATTNRVLILHGVQDKLMPIRNALLGVWKLLGAWMLQFPGEGHGIPFSNVQGVIVTTLEFFNFANPLTQSEILQWDNYGDTAATRGTGVDTTLIVKSAVVGEAGTGR